MWSLFEKLGCKRRQVTTVNDIEIIPEIKRDNVDEVKTDMEAEITLVDRIIDTEEVPETIAEVDLETPVTAIFYKDAEDTLKSDVYKLFKEHIAEYINKTNVTSINFDLRTDKNELELDMSTINKHKIFITTYDIIGIIKGIFSKYSDRKWTNISVYEGSNVHRHIFIQIPKKSMSLFKNKSKNKAPLSIYPNVIQPWRTELVNADFTSKFITICEDLEN